MKKAYEKPVLTKRGILSSITAQVIESGLSAT
ncbi:MULTISPECIES: putative RiPP precursor [Mesorhizobium]|nr:MULTISPECIES: putative RiPP precursor [Mesorhizobium]MCF6126585.1 putative RiPP precursor [Mesorhizobium ciceri]MCQ8817731.1 putative RiPP precursor [Mesorhizobium sp. SEMIA396]MCQ8871936.1 putative RiPP precursor [Mesorhizobium sp. LMG17149]